MNATAPTKRPGIDSGSDKNIGTNQCNLLCIASTKQYCGGSGQPQDAVISVYKRVVSVPTLLKPAFPPKWSFNSCLYIDAWVVLLTTGTTGTTGNSLTTAGVTDGITCSDLCFPTKSTYITAVVSG